MKTGRRKSPAPNKILDKIQMCPENIEVLTGVPDSRRQDFEEVQDSQTAQEPLPPPPKDWVGDLLSWLDHCQSIGWGGPYLAWCEEVRAWRRSQSGGAGEVEASPAAEPYVRISPEAMRAPKRFKVDLDRLRHYKTGDQEIDVLAMITNDDIAKDAEERTGRKAEEILSKCTLLLSDVQFLDSWIVLWPNRFIRAEDQFPVRLLLQFAWWYSTQPNQDQETDRALASVSDAITRFRADRELDARQKKLDAEQERRSAGGRAAAMSEKRNTNREAVMREWASLNNKSKHDRAAIIAERLGITAGQVRRHVKKAGLR